MTIREQLELWVEGNSVHNPDRDECTPDFSCCDPELRAPLKERVLFWEAYKRNDTSIMEALLFKFLNAGVKRWAPEKNIEVRMPHD